MSAELKPTNQMAGQDYQPNHELVYRWEIIPSNFSYQTAQQNMNGRPKDAIHWTSDMRNRYVIVNSKQFNRILQRRKERQRQLELHAGSVSLDGKKQKVRRGRLTRSIATRRATSTR